MQIFFGLLKNSSKNEENVGGYSAPSKMETAMGNLGSPRLHYLESYITNVSNSLRSIQKTNKYKLDNNAIVVCLLAS